MIEVTTERARRESCERTHSYSSCIDVHSAISLDQFAHSIKSSQPRKRALDYLRYKVKIRRRGILNHHSRIPISSFQYIDSDAVLNVKQRIRRVKLCRRDLAHSKHRLRVYVMPTDESYSTIRSITSMQEHYLTHICSTISAALKTNLPFTLASSYR